MLESILLDDGDRDKYLEVLSIYPNTPHFYSWEWRKVIKESFGHEPYYLFISQNGVPLSVCPLFHVQSKLFGSALISLPYLNGGGFLGENDQSILFLIDEISKLQEDLSCDYAEIRSIAPLKLGTDKVKLRDHKVSMKLNLKEKPEDLFSSFPPKLRSQIRRPSKEGCKARIIPGDEVSLKEINHFYTVFCQTMKELGTPVYPKKLFANTLKEFGKNSFLGIVYHDQDPISAGITIKNGNLMEIPWASSLKSKSKFAPNMLLYWEHLKNACLNNCTTFDFGRSSPNSGTFKFKSQWGAKPETLYWYYTNNSKKIPDINPNNEKFKLLVEIWKKLPLPLCNFIGPYITKSLP